VQRRRARHSSALSLSRDFAAQTECSERAQTGVRFAKGEHGLWKTETEGMKIIRAHQKRGI